MTAGAADGVTGPADKYLPVTAKAAGAAGAGGTGIATRGAIAAGGADRHGLHGAVGTGGGHRTRSGVDAVCAGQSGPTGPTGTAVAEQSDGVAAVAAGPCVTAVAARQGGTAGPAITAVAVEPSAGSAVAAGRAGTPGAAGAAVAPQTGGTARATSHPGGGTAAALAAIAVEDSAGAARLSYPVDRLSVGAVADERATQQRLGGRVDQAERLLLQDLQRRGIGGLGAGIPARTRGQGLHELAMKRGRLGAERLIFAGVRGKQCCDLRRHLVGGGGHQLGRRNSRCRIGHVDR
ncbi:hypothetical protein LAUMK41_01232 [Mycobacterium attenuatum]|nr:hypothetical protein LAUMK41_01232 [Mycobacterium attenuatum]